MDLYYRHSVIHVFQVVLKIENLLTLVVIAHKPTYSSSFRKIGHREACFHCKTLNPVRAGTTSHKQNRYLYKLLKS